MGKVAKPLTIVVLPPLDEWPEIEKLERQGHTIIRANDKLMDIDVQSINVLPSADIILGPRCWYLTGLHRGHLQSALKQARLRRYGTIAKKGKNNEKDTNLEVEIPNNSDPESAGC